MQGTFPPSKNIAANGIHMAVHELGVGPPVILVHGFPELAFSWRHQMPALAAAGYRAIAPDMRGYGGTDKPPRVDDYTVQKLIGDVTSLMDALDLEKAAVVGHDWGALLGWQMALLEPKRIACLAALNIPFFRRPPLNPLTLMRLKLGKDFYIVNFQLSDEADQRFGEDPARFIDAVMRKRRIGRDVGKKPASGRTPFSLLQLLDRDDPGGEPLLSEDELTCYARAFQAGGFTGPINWYRNWSHNWKSTRGVAQTVRVPALFVGASDESLISKKQIEAMKADVPDLEIRIIEDCGHWTQQEKPAELNAILLSWLSRRYPASAP